MYKAVKRLILASGSPRRRELLSGCGLKFEVIIPGSDETPEDGESPEEMVKRLAMIKAEEISRQHSAAAVIGADTTVVLGKSVMGKPSDVKEAQEMLSKLQGNYHEVWGGFALLNPKDGVRHVEAHCTKVKIASLGQQAIKAYVQTGEPMDKAGAYAAQGIGAAFIERIEGSYTNVVGLPLTAVLATLVRYGIIEV